MISGNKKKNIYKYYKIKKKYKNIHKYYRIKYPENKKVIKKKYRNIYKYYDCIIKHPGKNICIEIKKIDLTNIKNIEKRIRTILNKVIKILHLELLKDMKQYDDYRINLISSIKHFASKQGWRAEKSYLYNISIKNIFDNKNIEKFIEKTIEGLIENVEKYDIIELEHIEIEII